jgi:hypothetical protein
MMIVTQGYGEETDVIADVDISIEIDGIINVEVEVI